MQSITRAIKRGNAVIYNNEVTKASQIIWKRGTERKFWNYVLRKTKVKEVAESEKTEVVTSKKRGGIKALFEKIINYIKSIFV